MSDIRSTDVLNVDFSVAIPRLSCDRVCRTLPRRLEGGLEPKSSSAQHTPHPKHCVETFMRVDLFRAPDPEACPYLKPRATDR